MSTQSRMKDAEMSKHLPPASMRRRSRPELWPYHNNLGTQHKRPVGKTKEE